MALSLGSIGAPTLRSTERKFKNKTVKGGLSSGSGGGSGSGGAGAGGRGVSSRGSSGGGNKSGGANAYLKVRDPGQYTSALGPKIADARKTLMNWKYNPMMDANYQALANVYAQRGNLAAQNTLGDAAALNGGLGTSYAVSAAQQARNQYNQELASLVPELEQNAYARAQGLYGMLLDEDNTAYSRYRDAMSDYQWGKNYNLGIFQNNRDFEFNKKQADREFKFNKKQADREFKFNKQQADRDYELQKKQYKASSSSSSNGGGGGYYDGGYGNGSTGDDSKLYEYYGGAVANNALQTAAQVQKRALAAIGVKPKKSKEEKKKKKKK